MGNLARAMQKDANQDLYEVDCEVTQSGQRLPSEFAREDSVRLAVREPFPTLPEGAALPRTVGRFSVEDAAARLPKTARDPIEVGVVEREDVASGAPRRVLIHAWPGRNGPWDRRYVIGSDARVWIGPLKCGGALEPVTGGRLIIVRRYRGRLLGAFELELLGAMVHGTFSALIRSRPTAP